eukprot:gene22349-33193_t
MRRCCAVQRTRVGGGVDARDSPQLMEGQHELLKCKMLTKVCMGAR